MESRSSADNDSSSGNESSATSEDGNSSSSSSSSSSSTSSSGVEVLKCIALWHGARAHIVQVHVPAGASAASAGAGASGGGKIAHAGAAVRMVPLDCRSFAGGPIRLVRARLGLPADLLPIWYVSSGTLGGHGGGSCGTSRRARGPLCFCSTQASASRRSYPWWQLGDGPLPRADACAAARAPRRDAAGLAMGAPPSWRPFCVMRRASRGFGLRACPIPYAFRLLRAE